MHLIIKYRQNTFTLETQGEDTIESLKEHISKICDVSHFELVFHGMILNNRKQQLSHVLYEGAKVFVRIQTQMNSFKKLQVRDIMSELIQQMNGRNSQQIQDIVRSLEHHQRVRILNIFNAMKSDEIEKLKPLIDELNVQIALVNI